MTPEQMTAVLVAQHQITEKQRATLLGQLHADSDKISFLELAHRQFGVDQLDLLNTLARHLQKSADHVKLSQTPHEPGALRYVPARDAWDYLILPLELEPDGTLLCCTTDETLPTALAYLMRSLRVPFHVVTADVRPLEQYIAEQYRYEGVDDAA
ncbi:MAG: hypothetical protein AAGL98_09230 [Planctomycetota bacterium]